GTYKRRKKIEKLIELASDYDFVLVRIIGPGVKENIRHNLPNVELFDGCIGDELTEHFLWSDLVLNPGSVGLLTMTAAKYNRPIIIDKYNYHGPEMQVAIDTNQYIIDISDRKVLTAVLQDFLIDKKKVVNKGIELRNGLTKSYLIEHMVNAYLYALKVVIPPS